MASPPTALPPIPADIGRVAGPLLIGLFLNWGLFGVLSMQVYMYYLAFPDDPGHNKVLIYSVYLIEAVQTFMLTGSGFHSFAEGFGNLFYLDEIGTLWFSVPIMSGIVAFIAQTFYAYRISILSQSRIIASFIFVLAIIQLGGSIATGYLSHKAVYHSLFLGRKSFITTGIWNGGSALCDIIIAVCMTVYLMKRNTGMKQTRVLIRKIVRLTIETGSLTAVIALLNFILALLPGRPTYYHSTAGIVGKLYANSMLVVLNSRMKIGPQSPSSLGDTSVVSTHRTRDHAGRPDAYQMHGGISVTREQVSFPPTDGSGWSGAAQEFDSDMKPIAIKV